MNKKRHLRHDDVEALLSGRSTEHPQVAAVVRALGAVSSEAGREREHLAAIHEAATGHAHGKAPAPSASRLASATAISRRRVLADRSKALVLKLSSSVVALSAATMGLAHAGVDLPGEAAEKAFAAVGIELPNQASDSPQPVAEDVESAKEATEPGCERGRAVATAASQNRKNQAKNQPSPCENDATDDVEAGSSSKGKASKKAGASKGAAESKEGRSKAEDAKEKVSEPDPSPPAGKPEGAGRPEGSERPEDAGQGKGGDRAENPNGDSGQEPGGLGDALVTPSTNPTNATGN